MLTTNDKTAQPRVVEVENMDEILGTASSVTLSGNNSKPSVFARQEADTSFLDKPGEAEKGDPGTDDENDPNKEDVNSDANKLKDKEPKPPVDDPNVDDVLAVITATPGTDEDDDEDEDGDEKPNKGGRKPALIETMNKLIERKTIELFEDEQDLSKYTNDDIVDLIEANIKKRVTETAKNAPLDVFKRLDPKVQDIIAFELNGGKDITSLLKVAAQSQEITGLDLEKEDHQERIIREWFRSTGSYTEDELEDEITSIIDRGDLLKKATQFKPKLDDKQSLIMKKKLDDQEKAKERADAAREKWSETIFHNLNKADLNGIPLNNKTQTMLFHGLTDNTTYQDRNGNPTNALGHFIEEYQSGENANPSILLEALWLMANPAEYRQNVLALGQKNTHTETFRNLKTAEGERTTSSSKQGEDRSAPSRNAGVKRTGSRKIFDR